MMEARAAACAGQFAGGIPQQVSRRSVRRMQAQRRLPKRRGPRASYLFKTIGTYVFETPALRYPVSLTLGALHVRSVHALIE